MERVYSNVIAKEYYQFSYPTKSVCLILNYEKFTTKKQRYGSNLDAEYLKKVFTGLEFDVMLHNDLTKKETVAVLKAAGKCDYSNSACFVCCILTHGDSGMLYAKDEGFHIELLFSSFFSNCCPSLEGKPRIFFIQACQGEAYDDGVQLESADGNIASEYPQHVDFLIMHSTVQGYFSWRSPDKGSWFIQTLCACLEKSKNLNLDLLKILHYVNYNIAYHMESYTPSNIESHEKKQIPCIISTLRRKIILSKKISVPSAINALRKVTEDLVDRGSGTSSVPSSTNAVENKIEDDVDRGSGTSGTKHENVPLGKLTVPMNSTEYRMKKPQKIKCLIFYNEEFNEHLSIQQLKGAETNAATVSCYFTELRFSVELIRNAEKNRILSTLKKVAQKECSKLDCLICFIMTRSDVNKCLYAKNGKYRKEEILSLFSGQNCPELASKPKIFIFQVCESDENISSDESSDSSTIYTIPTQADFIIVDSTAKDYYYQEVSSNFIQNLYKVLKEGRHQMDFVEMITLINDNLTDNGDYYRNERTLCLTSTLTRSLSFQF